MFATGLIPSMVFFLGLLFIPESPRWLVKAGFKEKALLVLERIGGDEFANAEIKEIEISLKNAVLSSIKCCLPKSTEK